MEYPPNANLPVASTLVAQQMMKLHREEREMWSAARSAGERHGWESSQAVQAHKAHRDAVKRFDTVEREFLQQQDSLYQDAAAEVEKLLVAAKHCVHTLAERNNVGEVKGDIEAFQPALERLEQFLTLWNASTTATLGRLMDKIIKLQVMPEHACSKEEPIYLLNEIRNEISALLQFGTPAKVILQATSV